MRSIWPHFVQSSKAITFTDVSYRITYDYISEELHEVPLNKGLVQDQVDRHKINASRERQFKHEYSFKIVKYVCVCVLH